MPLFLFIFFIFCNIHTIIQSHSYNTFAEASLHLLIASKLSGTDLPEVPSRESNSGLPSSKPTRYQLSHAAPRLYLFQASPVSKLNFSIITKKYRNENKTFAVSLKFAVSKLINTFDTTI